MLKLKYACEDGQDYFIEFHEGSEFLVGLNSNRDGLSISINLPKLEYNEKNKYYLFFKDYLSQKDDLKITKVELFNNDVLLFDSEQAKTQYEGFFFRENSSSDSIVFYTNFIFNK